MLRIIISLLLLTTLAPVTAPAQSQLPPRDTTVKQIGGLVTETDSSIARWREVAPIEVPPQRSGICGSIPRWKCALYGALVVGGIGYQIGYSSSPKPKYHKVGLLFDDEECYENCAIFPHKAVVFALSGSAIGGFTGWLLGKKHADPKQVWSER